MLKFGMDKITIKKEWTRSTLNPKGVESLKETLEFNLDVEDDRTSLIRILRVIDGDFDKSYAQDPNLKYGIVEIIFYNGYASGEITRNVLDRKIGYQQLYTN